MPGLLAEIKRKLSRIFLGRIFVRPVGEIQHGRPLAVSSHKREVAVLPARSEARVNSSQFVRWNTTVAIGAGAVIRPGFAETFKAAGMIVPKPTVEVKSLKVKIDVDKFVSDGRRKIQRLPITRRNRLNYLRTKPKFERATLLALYSPIYQEKVKRSALDKASGNLIFWYDNNRIKAGQRCHLLLLRVFGESEPLKWMWLPADKKIN